MQHLQYHSHYTGIEWYAGIDVIDTWIDAPTACGQGSLHIKVFRLQTHRRQTEWRSSSQCLLCVHSFINTFIHSFICLVRTQNAALTLAKSTGAPVPPEFSQAALNDAGKISSGATPFVYLCRNDAESLSRAADSPRTAEPRFSTFVSRFHSRLRPRDKLSKRVCSRPSVRRRYVTPAVKVSSRFLEA